jgi:hypothetical protein
MQGDSFAANAITVSRFARRRKTTAPDASSPTRRRRQQAALGSKQGLEAC